MHSPTTLPELRSAVVGRWSSLSIELRPTEDRAGRGVIEPTYLTRDFTYRPDDTFVGIIRMFGDDYGHVPLLEFEFAGELRWGGAHPIAEGAFSVDYILNETFAVTPLNAPAAEMLNQVPAPGVEPFEANQRQDILGRAFPLFAIEEGQIVTDYDLLYLRDDMLFFGAKHVDGTPFDRPERRPHQLQVPLVRGS
ncbi:MAG: hypothetical protein AAF389_11320 [Gemmatimonadota bacterium]